MATSRLLFLLVTTVSLLPACVSFANLLPAAAPPRPWGRASPPRATNGFLGDLSASQQAPAGDSTSALRSLAHIQGACSRRDLLRIAGASALLGALPRGSSAAGGKGTVLVVGTTGYIGVAVAKELVSQGYTIRGLSRRDDVKANSPVDFDVEWVVGDLTQPSSLKGLLVGVDKVVWCIGSGAGGMLGLGGYGAGEEGANRNIFVEAVSNIAGIARREAPGLSSYVLLSSTGLSVVPGSRDAYPEALAWKAEGEEALRKSGVPYTILRYGVFRPSLSPKLKAGKIDIRQGDSMSDKKNGISVTNMTPVIARCLSDPRCANKTLFMQDRQVEGVADWEEKLASLVDDARA